MNDSPLTEEALAIYWRALKKTITYAPEILGICREWRNNPFRYGPPLTKELDTPKGGKLQMFAHGAIEYDPEKGFIAHLPG